MTWCKSKKPIYDAKINSKTKQIQNLSLKIFSWVITQVNLAFHKYVLINQHNLMFVFFFMVGLLVVWYTLIKKSAFKKCIFERRKRTFDFWTLTFYFWFSLFTFYFLLLFLDFHLPTFDSRLSTLNSWLTNALMRKIIKRASCFRIYSDANLGNLDFHDLNWNK